MSSVSSLQDVTKRVQDEKDYIDKNIARLTSFLENKNNVVSATQLLLMKAQLEAMQKLSSVLGQRLSDFDKQKAKMVEMPATEVRQVLSPEKLNTLADRASEILNILGICPDSLQNKSIWARARLLMDSIMEAQGEHNAASNYGNGERRTGYYVESLVERGEGQPHPMDFLVNSETNADRGPKVISAGFTATVSQDPDTKTIQIQRIQPEQGCHDCPRQNKERTVVVAEATSPEQAQDVITQAVKGREKVMLLRELNVFLTKTLIEVRGRIDQLSPLPDRDLDVEKQQMFQAAIAVESILLKFGFNTAL